MTKPLILAVMLTASLSFAQTKKATAKPTAKPAAKTVAPAAPAAKTEEATAPSAKDNNSEPIYNSAKSNSSETSQTYFMPDEGQSAVTAGLEYITTGTRDVKSGSRTIYSTKTSGLIFAADYSRGLSKTSNLGATIGYWSLSTEASNGLTGTSKTSGLTDIFINYRGTNMMDSMELLYGVTLGVSPTKSVVASTTKDGTATSGGLSLKPMIGIQFHKPTGLIGAQLSYRYKADRTIESGNRDVTYTGENEIGLTGYYETQVSNFTLVPQLTLTNIGEQKVNGTSGFESYTNFAGAVFAYIPMGPTSKLIAGYTGTMYGTMKLGSAEISSALGHELAVGGRFLF